MARYCCGALWAGYLVSHFGALPRRVTLGSHMKQAYQVGQIWRTAWELQTGHQLRIARGWDLPPGAHALAIEALAAFVDVASFRQFGADRRKAQSLASFRVGTTQRLDVRPSTTPLSLQRVPSSSRNGPPSWRPRSAAWTSPLTAGPETALESDVADRRCPGAEADREDRARLRCRSLILQSPTCPWLR